MINFYEIISLFEDEEISGSFRRHAIVLVKPLAPLILGLFLLFLFMFPLFNLGPWGVGFFLLVLILDGALIARSIMSWYGSFYIITNRRLFSITRSGFFKKQVHELTLSKIAALSYHKKGIAQTLFKYGTVVLGVRDEFNSKIELSQLPHPQRVLEIISRHTNDSNHAATIPMPL